MKQWRQFSLYNYENLSIFYVINIIIQGLVGKNIKKRRKKNNIMNFLLKKKQKSLFFNWFETYNNKEEKKNIKNYETRKENLNKMIFNVFFLCCMNFLLCLLFNLI